MRSHIKTLLHLCREHVIQHTSNNIIGAEIGVWMGNTSTLFLKNNLKKLYMVDAYSIEPYKENIGSFFGDFLIFFMNF